jgi:hypothetical protein
MAHCDLIVAGAAGHAKQTRREGNLQRHSRHQNAALKALKLKVAGGGELADCFPIETHLPDLPEKIADWEISNSSGESANRSGGLLVI